MFQQEKLHEIVIVLKNHENSRKTVNLKKIQITIDLSVLIDFIIHVTPLH